MDNSALCNFYFKLGASFNDVLYFLAQIHGICISARTLKRFAVGQRLFRRTTFYMILAGARLVQTLTEQQIVSKSQIPTPQWLLQECIRKRIYVSQQIIIILMAVLDPVQVELHLRRRMRRKGRLGPGPDYVWNIGTFCELQQYGISCNVCMDEYSGNVIFANICKANSSDSELLNFYTKVVKMRKGCPVLLKIKSDLNCNEFNRVSGTQVIVARNTPAFCLQLEKFWKYLRSRIKRWPILCSSLQKDGLLATNDLSWQRQIRQIQDDIENLNKAWNSKTFRLRHGNIAYGRPAVLYTMPVLYGTRSYLQPV